MTSPSTEREIRRRRRYAPSLKAKRQSSLPAVPDFVPLAVPPPTAKLSTPPSSPGETCFELSLSRGTIYHRALAGESGGPVWPLDEGAAGIIRIDEIRLATEPLDMRTDSDTALARVV